MKEEDPAKETNRLALELLSGVVLGFLVVVLMIIIVAKADVIDTMATNFVKNLIR